MDYLITGVTGLLGSHIFFELLEKIIRYNSSSKLFLLIRPFNNMTPIERGINIFAPENIPEFIKKYSINILKERFQIIPCHLNCKELFHIISNIDTKKLTVIHCAASTNLMTDKATEQELLLNNNLGTINLINNIDSKKLYKFIYISTAFVNRIKNIYRNPYEETKSTMETYISSYCKKYNIHYQILRPSVICGRLIDFPLYITLKFDVFYGWAYFFYRYKMDMPIRIHINLNETLNIVPVDYVAKIICKSINEDFTELNIINPNPPLHKEYFSVILNMLNVKEFEFVDKFPNNLNKFEKLYYRTVGKTFAPYITVDNQKYNSNLSHEIFNSIQYPDVLEHFSGLIKYAIDKEFKP